MKLVQKIIMISTTVLFFSGCIDMQTTITVNKDGSGMVEENIFMGKEIINMFKEFASAFADSTEPNKEFNFFEESEIKSKASDFGEGITFVSMENIKTDEKEGYKAIYEFKDLNNVKVNQDPANEVPMTNPAQTEEPKNEYVYFKFTKGHPNRIVFRLPDSEDKKEEKIKQSEMSETDETNAEADSSNFDEMIKFMKDMRAKIEIKVNGNITKTNATHVDGNTITLFDINFSELLSDADKLEKFKKLNPNSFEEVKELVADIPGIKVELNKEVFIEFE